MNVSTTTGQARIQPHEGSAVRPAQRVMGGGFLIGLEWQRECQADAEVEWLLKQNGVASQPSASRCSGRRWGRRSSVSDNASEGPPA